MKGAWIVADCPTFFEDVRRVLLAHGASATDMAAAHPDIHLYDPTGKLLLAYPSYPDRVDNYRDGSLAIGSGSSIPDLTKVVGIEIECRWEQFFADTMALLAAELGYAFWVVDEMDIVWAGDAVDPLRVRL